MSAETPPNYPDISVDLVSRALDELNFLKLVDANPKLRSPGIIKQAITRYEQLWLPLVAKQPLEFLPAPLDIQWVWHCHLLSPHVYRKDCMMVIGCIPTNETMSYKTRVDRLPKSLHIWKELYPSEPFESLYDESNMSSSEALEGSQISYNLMLATDRQSAFYYNVSLPHYRSKPFLEEAFNRYKKMLMLKKLNPGEFLVPCYDVDLIWHTHQLHHEQYKHDTETYLGRMLNHDDTTTDRNFGSKLVESDKKTRQLWRDVYNEGFPKPGCMYRGIHPRDSIEPLTTEQCYVLCDKAGLGKVTFGLSDIKVVGFPDEKFKLEVSHVGGRTLETLTGSHPDWEWPFFIEIDFDRSKGKVKDERSKVIELNCSVKYLSWLWRKIATKRIDLTSCFRSDNAGYSTGASQVTVQVSLETTMKKYGHRDKAQPILELTLTDLTQPEMEKSTRLFLKPFTENLFITENIGADAMQSWWEPMYLPNLSESIEEEEKCIVTHATHTLNTSTNTEAFRLRISHSKAYGVSAIQMYHKRALVGMAHQVTYHSGQIPAPCKYRGDFCMYVIKTADGDFATCFGHQIRVNSQGGGDDAGNLLEIDIHTLTNNKWETIPIPLVDFGDIAICSHNVTISLLEGTIDIALPLCHQQMVQRILLAITLTMIVNRCNASLNKQQLIEYPFLTATAHPSSKNVAEFKH